MARTVDLPMQMQWYVISYLNPIPMSQNFRGEGFFFLSLRFFRRLCHGKEERKRSGELCYHTQCLGFLISEFRHIDLRGLRLSWDAISHVRAWDLELEVKCFRCELLLKSSSLFTV